MSPRPDVSSERRQQIYHAALSCFGRKGYHQTTMDDIVAESGLSKGTLYWYFKSKKELFVSLFQETMAQFGGAWEQVVQLGEGSATDKLLASMALFRSELEEMVPFFGIMMEAWALTRHDEDVEDLTRTLYQPYLAMMTQIIQEGVESGEFDVGDPQAAALVVMTLFDGLMLALGTGLATTDWNSLMGVTETLVLRGLGAATHDS